MSHDCSVNTFNCNFNAKLPSYFLIGEFWKVPKNEGITRQCHTFPLLVSLPTGPDSGPGHFSQASLELSHHQQQPEAATPDTGKLVPWPFTVTSADDIQQWGCRIKHYIHIKSNSRVPPVAPSALKSRNLVADIKASEALDGLGCCQLRA